MEIILFVSLRDLEFEVFLARKKLKKNNARLFVAH